MPDFLRACPAAEVPPGAMKRVVLDDTPVAIYNCGGALTATADTCTHAEASLADGALDCAAGTVECPLHGAKFDIRTGKALSLPAVSPVKAFAVKVEGGEIFVRV